MGRGAGGDEDQNRLMNAFDEGPALECPACGRFSPHGTHRCDCGHDFIAVGGTRLAMEDTFETTDSEAIAPKVALIQIPLARRHSTLEDLLAVLIPRRMDPQSPLLLYRCQFDRLLRHTRRRVFLLDFFSLCARLHDLYTGRRLAERG